MLKRILLIVAALVLIAVVIGVLLPAKVVVARSVTIDRPASLVFATVNSFQLFPKWSPWQDLDPKMRQSTEGPREGIGAKLVWSGNDKVGTGSQIITAFVPNQSVDSDLDFGAMGVAKSKLTLTPAGNFTQVTWTLTMDMGKNPIAHYFGLAMDRMIGPDFARGLGKLKTVLENMPDQDIADLDIQTVELSASPILLVSETTAMDAVAKGYIDAFGQIGKFMAKNKLKQSGAPFGIEGAITATNYSFDAGMPVDRGDAKSADGVRVSQSYAGKALKAVHVGPYETMNQTRDKLLASAAAHGYTRSGAPVYSYVDDPGKIAAAQVRTEIYAPIESP
jgi:effector-binding domain-containing protein